MKCPSCGHEVLEPLITGYCTNCGKPLGAAKENSTPISALSPQTGRAEPIFLVRELNPALFPVAASVIPVAVLSYFAGGTAAAAVLTLLDLVLSITIYLRSSTFQFWESKLQVFDGTKLKHEISYAQIYAISPQTAEEFEGKFVIHFEQGTRHELEIPANPIDPALKMDLFSWLTRKVKS